MKRAKANLTGGHKHRPHTSQGNVNYREYRATATWPDRDATVTYGSPDKRAIRRKAKLWAADGGFVRVDLHEKHGVFELLYELDGPAMVAAREATEALLAAQQAEDDRQAARTQRNARNAARVATAAEADRAAQDAADGRVRAELARRARDHRAEVHAARDRAQTAALMQQPPVPRPNADRRARHTAGGH